MAAGQRHDRKQSGLERTHFTDLQTGPARGPPPASPPADRPPHPQPEKLQHVTASKCRCFTPGAPELGQAFLLRFP